MPGLDVRTARSGSWLIVRVAGELDVAGAEPLREALEAGLAEQGVRDLCLNLSEVPFVDSSGIGVILGRYRRLHQQGGRMAIVGARPAVRTVLELSGVLKIIPLFESEPEALAPGRNR